MMIIKKIQNEMLQVVITICVFFLLVLTSCAGRELQPEAMLAQHAPETKTDKLNTEITQKSILFQKTSSAADYKIGPEDLLEVTVFQAKELDTIARVSASGFIKLPLIDKVEASGRTTSELESVITEKFKIYLSEPVVGVFIREYRSQQITVLGSVRTPGVYYVSGQKSLLELLSLAGGLSGDAGDICIVQRNATGNQQEHQSTDNIVIDLDQLLIKGQVGFNIAMNAGDVILVPKSGLFFIDGAVKNPGSFPLKGKITFTQAISLAKGLSLDAKTSDIKIYRDTGKQERDVITLDYDDILDRKLPDIEIKDKDVIIVSSSTLKRIYGGLAGYFNFGYFGFSGVRPGAGMY
jgi:polysaccharide export outer membrane protein